MITVLAESLETVLLACAASLLAAAKLRVNARSNKPSLDANVRKSRIHSLRRRLAVHHVTDIFSFFCIAAGMALLGNLGGSASLETIRAALSESYQPERLDLLVGDGSILGIAAIVLIFVGSAAAFGLFPMHGIVQNAFESSPAGIAGSTALLQRLQAAVILWKIAVTSMPGFESTTQMMCVVFGTCSCLVGSILVCRSESLRNVAGNLWITWGGVVLVAAAAGMPVEAPTNFQTTWQLPTGLETAAFSLVISTVAVGLLLVSERWLSHVGRSIDFAEDVTGLGHQRGLVALAIACSLLTLSAIPPLPGFWCATFVAGNAFLPGVESAQGASLVPDTSVLCSAIVLLISLLVVSARSVHFLSLMFHHEPIRRFNIGVGKLPVAISLMATGILLWVGLNVGTSLTWFHRLPL
ncbi:MAG: formate hydrogenlyase subunit 3/multisubunit Na+/H+ antiporter MnhD subunit [Planctomycetaceae bacterium]